MLAELAVLASGADELDRAEARSGEALEIVTRAGVSAGIARILDSRAMATFLHSDIG